MAPPARWWQRWDVWAGIFATILIGAVLGVPPLLSRVSVAYAGSQKYRGKDAPAFTVTNEGVFGINAVTGECIYERVIYDHPDLIAGNNIQAFRTQVKRLETTEPFTLLCPFEAFLKLPKPPTGGTIKIYVQYRADYSWKRSDVIRPFESEGDIFHWTPPRLR